MSLYKRFSWAVKSSAVTQTPLNYPSVAQMCNSKLAWVEHRIKNLGFKMTYWNAFKRKLFLMGALLLFMACNGQKKMTRQNGAELNPGLELIVRDDHSGAEVSETIVIKDAKALKSFYSKINMTRKPGLPLPEVNFEKEMIVITCSGERNDGALPTLLVKEETTSQMILFRGLHTDKNNNFHAITSPFSIYKMPFTDKEIIFEEVKP